MRGLVAGNFEALEEVADRNAVLFQEERNAAYQRFEGVMVAIRDLTYLLNELHVVKLAKFVFLEVSDESLKIRY